MNLHKGVKSTFHSFRIVILSRGYVVGLVRIWLVDIKNVFLSSEKGVVVWIGLSEFYNLAL